MKSANFTPAVSLKGEEQHPPGRSGVVATHLGEIPFTTKQIITIPKAILGFEALKRYLLVEHSGWAPFLWLVAVDRPEVAFAVVNPLLFFPGYHIEVDRRELAELEIANPAAVHTYAIVTIPHDLRLLSVNLQGPILINNEKNLGKQVVLSKSPYCTRHFIFEELRRQYQVPSRTSLKRLSAV